MRCPAALTFAALFVFTLSSLFTQAQTSQTNPPSPEKPAETEKSQSSEKAQSSTENPESAQEQQKPSGQGSSTSEKSTPTEKLQSEKPLSSAGKSESAQKQQNPFDKFQQFSATLSGGPLRFDNMPIYRSGNKIRTDWAYEHETRVSDLSRGNAWYIRHWPGKPGRCGPSDKMDIGSYPFFAYTGKDYKVEHLASAEPAEKETYDGHLTKIEHYTATRVSDGVIIAKVKMWEAEDLNGFPVRMEIDPPLMGDKVFNLYYTNVSLQRPDAKLFDVPAKCLKEDTILETTLSPKSNSSKPAASPKSDKSSAPPQ